jgi:hypothetical protein
MGIANIGSSQTSASGIFLVTLAGSIVATIPTMSPTMRTVATQPYQYMAGPSPLLAASQPQANRFVAGWKVKSGRFNSTQITYITGEVIAIATVNALNLVDEANVDLAGVALLDDA